MKTRTQGRKDSTEHGGQQNTEVTIALMVAANLLTMSFDLWFAEHNTQTLF